MRIDNCTSVYHDHTAINLVILIVHNHTSVYYLLIKNVDRVPDHSSVYPYMWI